MLLSSQKQKVAKPQSVVVCKLRRHKLAQLGAELCQRRITQVEDKATHRLDMLGPGLLVA